MFPTVPNDFGQLVLKSLPMSGRTFPNISNKPESVLGSASSQFVFTPNGPRSKRRSHSWFLVTLAGINIAHQKMTNFMGPLKVHWHLMIFDPFSIWRRMQLDLENLAASGGLQQDHSLTAEEAKFFSLLSGPVTFLSLVRWWTWDLGCPKPPWSHSVEYSCPYNVGTPFILWVKLQLCFGAVKEFPATSRMINSSPSSQDQHVRHHCSLPRGAKWLDAVAAPWPSVPGSL